LFKKKIGQKQELGVTLKMVGAMILLCMKEATFSMACCISSLVIQPLLPWTGRVSRGGLSLCWKLWVLKIHWNLNAAFIDQSQGQLHYLNASERDASTLSVWILENYQSGEWNFKYNINTSQLFGYKGFINGGQYTWIAIHPECSLIFYITRKVGAAARRVRGADFFMYIASLW
jgi:hypothetical protein